MRASCAALCSLETACLCCVCSLGVPLHEPLRQLHFVLGVAVCEFAVCVCGSVDVVALLSLLCKCAALMCCAQQGRMLMLGPRSSCMLVLVVMPVILSTAIKLAPAIVQRLVLNSASHLCQCWLFLPVYSTW